MTHKQFERHFQKELKCCAHCGARPRLVQWRDTAEPNATWVECPRRGCGVMTPSFYHREYINAAAAAIKAWNRRTK
jgi:hypothetical protein